MLFRDIILPSQLISSSSCYDFYPLPSSRQIRINIASIHLPQFPPRQSRFLVFPFLKKVKKLSLLLSSLGNPLLNCGNPCSKFIFLLCDKSESNFLLKSDRALDLFFFSLLMSYWSVRRYFVCIFLIYQIISCYSLFLWYGYEFLFLVSDRWISD